MSWEIDPFILEKQSKVRQIKWFSDFINIKISEDEARSLYENWSKGKQKSLKEEFEISVVHVSKMRVSIKEYVRQMLSFIRILPNFLVNNAFEEKHNEIGNKVNDYCHDVIVFDSTFINTSWCTSPIIEEIYRDIIVANVELLPNFIGFESIDTLSEKDLIFYEKRFNHFSQSIGKQLTQFRGNLLNLCDFEDKLCFESFEIYKQIKAKFDKWVENENKVKNWNEVMAELKARDERIVSLEEEMKKLRTDSESQVKSLKEVMAELKTRDERL